MGFYRQEYMSGLPFPIPGDLPDPEIKLSSLMSPALAGGFFTTVPSGKQISISISIYIYLYIYLKYLCTICVSQVIMLCTLNLYTVLKFNYMSVKMEKVLSGCQKKKKFRFFLHCLFRHIELELS